jgi:putative tryptophan/tyrosine transport system substrate-binding protein
VAQLSRRQVVRGVGAVGLTLLAACGRLPWQAPQAPKVHRIGILSGSASDDPIRLRRIDIFRQELREYGYVEGQNVTFELAWAEGQLERLPELAAELVRRPVDLLLAGETASTLGAMRATTTIPIVFAQNGDPIGSGTVASLARPGGNVTGMSNINPRLAGKRLELLTQVTPGIARVAVLWDTAGPAVALQIREIEVAAQVLGVQLQSLGVVGPTPELDSAFDAAARERAEALVVIGNPLLAGYQPQIISLATRDRLPAMYTSSDWCHAGGLMSYAANQENQWRRVAYYVDRILKGTKPADLPVEQPTRFDFAINLTTAHALGLSIPQHVLLQATEVIQ